MIHTPSWLRRRLGLLAFGLVVIGYGAVMLSHMPPGGTLDSRIHYTRDDIHTLFEAQGVEGRGEYRTLASLDLAFPFFYCTLFLLWLRVLRREGDARSRPGLALISGVFDLIETVCILAMLDAFPDLPSLPASIAMASTPFKWASIAIAGAAIVMGEIRLRPKRSTRERS